ncbi:MAG: dihydropteroate synthase, partial [Coprococcus sp.]
TDPKTAVIVMQSLGVDAVGLNCSTGPEEMLAPVKEMVAYANIPVLAKPNAGLPELVDEVTVYNTTPEEFATVGKKLVEAGACIVGGCCGTTPEHIKALAEAVKDVPLKEISKKHRRVVTSERKTVEMDLDGQFLVVGERINPTGKKKLQAELKEGSLDLVRSMAREQEENGAAILDVNMGMNGIDEKQMMLDVIYEVSAMVDCPLCIDSSHVDIIEAALRIYPGRALINSISLEKEKFEKLLPIARKYGAMFILLPLSDEGLPKSLEEKKNIINIILEKALALGFAKEDIVVDGLVATVGANPKAALECFDTISYCKDELELATICGLSNISFGLPDRQFVNTAFLTMAIDRGLTMAIANPSQTMLMNAAYASDMLLNKEEADIRYIENVRAIETTAGSGISKPQIVSESENESVGSVIYNDVLKGNKRTILDDVQNALDTGTDPQDIIDRDLIPAINKVGEFFEKKKYFLPQLIGSAETMEMAISVISPLILKDKDNTDMPTIVVATVEGDIHDIGKNLVVLMLRNYGFNVIDLGKDVPCETILEAAEKNNASIIGLSALMTTTMVKMKEVTDAVRERKLPYLVIIGGAVITESYAEEIGADGYSKDAADAVVLVKKLLKIE